MTKQTIEQRITAILSNENASAAEISEILLEIEGDGGAIATAEANVTAARERAADVIAAPTPREAQDAIAVADAAALELARLRRALPKLRDRLSAALEVERHAKWFGEFKAVEAQRDALISEFNEKFTHHISELSDLLARMVACDSACQRVDETASLLVNEHTRLGKPSASIPRDLVLVNLSNAQLWPPRSTLATDVAAMMVPVLRPFECSGDWWRATPAYNPAIREQIEREQERQGDSYRQQTAQQEARLNAEEKERFASMRRTG